MKVDIVTSDDIKIYYTRKFQDFTAWYIIKGKNLHEKDIMALYRPTSVQISDQ